MPHETRSWIIITLLRCLVCLCGAQDDQNIDKTLTHVMTPAEMDMIKNSQHRVVKSISVLAEIIKQANLPPLQNQLMMLNVQMFYDLMGMCERIYRTPLPLVYTR
jgi:predicted membrane chloride channel (bestrophin family)